MLKETHWKAACRALRYLKGTSDYGLLIDGNEGHLEYEVYTDVSYANQEKVRTSISGFLVKLDGTCISWASGKQNCVALSTAESELIALSEGVKESEWLWHLTKEIGLASPKTVQV